MVVVTFLGHITSKEGITVDPTKVETVSKWKWPENPIEIQNLLRLVEYNRRFIKNFSKIAKPLTELTKKHDKFIWNPKCEKGFQELKKCLTKVPVLALPSGGDGFLVYTDSSKDDLGCVLMQNGKVIAYASYKLKPHE